MADAPSTPKLAYSSSTSQHATSVSFSSNTSSAPTVSRSSSGRSSCGMTELIREGTLKMISPSRVSNLFAKSTRYHFTLKYLTSDSYLLQYFESAASKTALEVISFARLVCVQAVPDKCVAQAEANVSVPRFGPGKLKYVGRQRETNNEICGIELLSHRGNCNGELEGHRYFTCADGRGIFVDADKVVFLDDDSSKINVHAGCKGHVMITYCTQRSQKEIQTMYLQAATFLDMTAWYFAFLHVKDSHYQQQQLIPSHVMLSPASLRAKQNGTGLYRKWLVYPWFHGPLSRDEAERRLALADLKDGCFLVRESPKEQRVVVSMIWQGQSQHALLEWVDERCLLDNLDFYVHLLAERQPVFNWSTPLTCFIDKADLSYEGPVRVYAFGDNGSRNKPLHRLSEPQISTFAAIEPPHPCDPNMPTPCSPLETRRANTLPTTVQLDATDKSVPQPCILITQPDDQLESAGPITSWI